MEILISRGDEIGTWACVCACARTATIAGVRMVIVMASDSVIKARRRRWESLERKAVVWCLISHSLGADGGRGGDEWRSARWCASKRVGDDGKK